MNGGSQKFHVTNIMWDLDAEDEHMRAFLPEEIYVVVDSDSDDLDDDDAVEELISDTLSDATGYCHCGFGYTIVKSV